MFEQGAHPDSEYARRPQTTDEARAALLAAVNFRINTGVRYDAIEPAIDALIAAVRAEGETKYRRALAVAADFRREQAESAETLRALREAAQAVVDALDAQPAAASTVVSRERLDALRALAVTPAEDER